MSLPNQEPLAPFTRKRRLAIVASHPIQYQVPLFRELTQHPRVDPTVFFCSDHGAVASIDSGFGQRFRWDLPMLEGYRHEFVPNNSPRAGVDRGFFGELNLGLVSRLRRGSFDAVLVHGYAFASCWLAFLGAKLGRSRLLLRMDSNLSWQRSAFKRAIKQLALPPTFGMFDAFLPIGSLNYEYYREYGVTPLKLVYAPFSVDNAYFERGAVRERPRRAEIRRSLGLPPDVPVALLCGKLIPLKRPFDFLDALKVSAANPRWHGLVVGDGALRARCEQHAQANIPGRVAFAGFRNQSELAAMYAAADVLVLSSDTENWGLVANEAMASGLPVILSTSVGAAPDLVRQRETGFVFPTGDVSALAKCLDAAVQPGQLDELRRGASARIAAWSIDVTVAGIARALEEPV